MSTLRERRRFQNDFIEELEQKGWYHSFEGIDGVMPLEWLNERWKRFPIPADLTGRRVLDIGPWDGWFSFEAERRGASVVSVDREEVPNYLAMHRRLDSKNDYRLLDLYELPGAGLGRFDIVFCLGVLYHLKHPVLGLEIVCSLATEVAIVETFIIEGDPEIPVMEFYETNELNGHMDNWVGPSANCVMAMCRTAGFARVVMLARDPTNISVACFRKWEPEPEQPSIEPPELLSAVNAATFSVNFASLRDEYLTCWFRTSAADVAREDLCLEIGGYGAPAVFVRRRDDGAWHANFRVPPGTPQGWNDVRLRLKNSRFGRITRIAYDLPLHVERLHIRGVCDGVTWRPNEIGETLACWVEGLPENADIGNVRLWIGDRRLRITWIAEYDSSGVRQINASVPATCDGGEFAVECGGVRSASLPVSRVSP
jgi:tRNA (mo5U34)-methyltransferase